MNRMHIFVLGWVALAGVGPLGAQDWPQWRGPNRDNKVVGFSVPKEWPKALTKKWSVSVGVGESSPVLVGDKIYVFSRRGKDEVTVCLRADSGKEIWQDKYEAEAVGGPASGHPGPRSTPAVGEGKVCTLGVGGVVSCLDAATGKVVWRKDTKSRPNFYTSTSPLIADGKCVVHLGKLTAFDLATGDVKWEWSGGGAPYGSPVLTTVDGVQHIVTPTGSNNLAGVGLADGKLLWQVKLDGAGYQANYSTPLPAGPIIYYSVASGGKGGKGNTIALKIDKKADGFSAGEVWSKNVAAAGYHTPLYRDGLIFGVNPARNFFCVDAKTGEELWKDSAKRGQCGAILDAGPILLALTSDSKLVAFQPSGKGFKEAAAYTVSDAETWCVPIIVGNRIFVKDKGGMLTMWTVE